jgi:hypothetical protein
MRKPRSVNALEALGRVRLSESFFMRDFLHSEIASVYGLSNIPDDPELAIAAGRRLCESLLEPLRAAFGRVSIRSAYRSPEVNGLGNARGHNCASNERSYGGHIWDRRDAAGSMGAAATVVVHAFVPYYQATGDWEAMAWWVHDHLPYSRLEFFPKLAAFNLGWSEAPERAIYSYIPPRRGWLTKPGRPNHAGDHSGAYRKLLAALGRPAAAGRPA